MSTKRGHSSGDEKPAPPVIAIDGGAATGKTTSAAQVAEKLGFGYIDSGAVYRAVALALHALGVNDAADPRIPRLLAELPLEIEPSVADFRVRLEGRELGSELRSPEVSSLSSRLAVRSDVRVRVRGLLRAARQRGPVVVEGRDIGTVVFPDAVLKVFLTAELPIRARRRRRELLDQGRDLSEEDVARDLAERDERDSTRSEGPLRPAEASVWIDTSATTVPGQVAAILEAYERVRNEGVS